jgi:hypothetical protein
MVSLDIRNVWLYHISDSGMIVGLKSRHTQAATILKHPLSRPHVFRYSGLRDLRPPSRVSQGTVLTGQS